VSYSASNRGVQGVPYHSIDNLTSGWMSYQAQPSSTGSAWGTQYRAIYVPIRVTAACVVLKLGYLSAATGTGDMDLGLYNSAGARLVSTGTITKDNSSAVVGVDITDTTISPGLYYLALNNASTTDTYCATALSAPIPCAYGVLVEELASVTLPATASWTVGQTLSFIPILSALLVTEVA